MTTAEKFTEDVFTEEEIRADIEQSADEEEDQTFAEQLQSFYGNEMDELHDSSGEPEYQQGVLGRMTACEQLAAKLDIPLEHMSQADKDAETPLYNK